MAEKCANEVSQDEILCTMIRLLNRLDVDVSEVKAEDQLLERLKDAVCKA